MECRAGITGLWSDARMRAARLRALGRLIACLCVGATDPHLGHKAWQSKRRSPRTESVSAASPAALSRSKRVAAFKFCIASARTHVGWRVRRPAGSDRCGRLGGWQRTGASPPHPGAAPRRGTRRAPPALGLRGGGREAGTGSPSTPVSMTRSCGRACA